MMLRHIVFIKIKESLPKEESLIELEKQLMALPDKIAEIKHYETGVNVSSSPAAYDLSLVSDFEGQQALDKYRVHPAHMEVLDYINEIKESIAVVDYYIKK